MEKKLSVKLIGSAVLAVAVLFAGCSKKAETKAKETVKKEGVKLKKDGTPDKRFKDATHLKKDGTPDKRYKENK